MKNTLPLLFLLVTLISCEHCGPQKELSLRIDIQRDSLQLDSVSAIGALDQTVFQQQVSNTTSGFRRLDLPISLLADSTTYIFAYETRTDTLTVFYKRDFYYKDGCGFVVDAHAPASATQVKSTFKKAGISYEPYVRKERRKWGVTGSDGISIFVEL
ncbi:hypothetical protein [Dyadobacter sp. CY326]|uniref:hypothetical protein n=1 Tax=Dyadobacter sp. CY326 TaxID=2907300 RepID=UPI001F16F2D3|nr:hypothetical protein [Dyadobacter sp. CY326]MCE7068100.1 hypothetical protein [Dyadobacter sp. CY326]